MTTVALCLFEQQVLALAPGESEGETNSGARVLQQYSSNGRSRFSANVNVGNQSGGGSKNADRRRGSNAERDHEPENEETEGQSYPWENDEELPPGEEEGERGERGEREEDEHEEDEREEDDGRREEDGQSRSNRGQQAGWYKRGRQGESGEGNNRNLNFGN